MAGQHVRAEIKNMSYTSGVRFNVSDVSNWYYEKNFLGINVQVYPGKDFGLALLPRQTWTYDFYHFKAVPVAWSFEINAISDVVNLRIRFYSDWMP